MSEILNIVRWEFWRTLRNKQFIIGMFVTPLMMALFIGVPELLDRFDAPKPYAYAVVDELGALPRLAESVPGNVRLESAATIQEAEERVESGEVDGYLNLSADYVETGAATVIVENPKHALAPPLRSAMAQLLQSLRTEASGLEASDVAWMLAQPSIAVKPRVEPADQDELSMGRRLVTAIGAGVLLVILVMASGAMLLQSALQEKRDKMSEVVLSSVTPDQFMAGKIIGHFLLGLVQVAFWLAIGIPAVTLLLKWPLSDLIEAEMLPLAGLAFLLGYMLFASIFVGVGATMEDMQSASNSQGMVFMLPFLSFIFIGPVINNPDGVIAQIGTFFPITAPFILMLRMGLTDVPLWEIAVGALVLLAAIVVVGKMAARLFRVGMLMYGKNATPKEIWRWLRHG